jgi:hypothetical protein
MAREAKEMVAIRLTPVARRKIKAVAARLRIKESDMLRFAIDIALQHLEPLSDQVKEGAEIMAPIIEHGSLFVRSLEMDVAEVDRILNGDLENPALRVETPDVEMALSGRQNSGYVDWWKERVTAPPAIDSRALETKTYLYEKYVEPALSEGAYEHSLTDYDRLQQNAKKHRE